MLSGRNIFSVSFVFRFFLIISSASGLLVYACVSYPVVYTKLLSTHTVAGVVVFLLLCVFLFGQLKNVSRKHARMFAFYPVVSVLSLETPVPLVVIFILNVTLVPLWFYFKFSERLDEREKLSFLFKFFVLYLLSCAVMTGMTSVIDPLALKFTSAFRKIHGYFVFMFVNVLAAYFFAGRRAQFQIHRVLNFPVMAAALVFLSAGEARLFKAVKNEPIVSSYKKHTFSTKMLSEKNKKAFKTLDVDALNRSEDCRFCHKIPFEQWEVSVHAYAGKNISFLKVLKSLTKQYGMEFGRLCITCHEPALAYSKNLSLIFDKMYLKERSEGVSCRVCHYMSGAHFKNAWFEVTLPRVDLTFSSRKKRQRYIFNAVQEHLSDVAKPSAKDGSVCFPCHSLESVRKGKTLIPYDNVKSFLSSPYSAILKCHDCHMPRLVEDDTHHYSWKDHRMFGSQRYLSEIAVLPEKNKDKTLKSLRQFEHETLLWLTGKLSFIDMVPAFNDETVKSYRIYNYAKAHRKLQTIYHVLQSKEPFVISLSSFKILREDKKKARKIEFQFSIFNSAVGHNYPSALFANISRTWVDVDVRDCRNKKILGLFNGKEEAYLLGRIEVKDDGAWIKPEESKLYTKIINNRFLEPLKAHGLSYSAALPDDACFPLTANVSVKTKRYADEFYDELVPEGAPGVKPRVAARNTFTIVE